MAHLGLTWYISPIPPYISLYLLRIITCVARRIMPSRGDIGRYGRFRGDITCVAWRIMSSMIAAAGCRLPIAPATLGLGLGLGLELG